MPVLNNARYEIIAHGLAAGLSQKKACAAAGFNWGFNRLARRPEIRARVRELKPAHPNGGDARSYSVAPVYTQDHLIAALMANAQLAQTSGNTREANIALKAVAIEIAKRDNLSPKTAGKTKGQRAQAAVEEGEDDDDVNDADDGATTDIQELSRSLEQFDNHARNTDQAGEDGDDLEEPEGGPVSSDGH